MKFTTRMGLAVVTGASALALAACGDSNDASDEVVAEDVEVVADDAMDGVADEPIEDDSAMPEAPPPAPASEGPTAEERAEADREKMQSDAEAAEAAAADIQAELDNMKTEN
ncbi:hypothetical protein KYN89_08095 [Alteriqipengyuania sp. NZ-12B]|uniref:Uncharacterized protein n=1 Tax=Alteriqipengyuania abyssalis TaxID=2860200 RepID=A0ABS7PD55_9SPHN|nr:hypothetical protein [Alteriqipengyuania abyssalis]MBY8337008.1 hypothetical protein [Alteriqipengyuania abyssalis]